MPHPRNTETIPSAREVEPIDLAFTPAPWTEQAACRFIGPAPFFPPNGGAARRITETAKAICAGCSVSAECLEFAMANEPDSRRYGIYAGLTPDERRQLHVQRQTQEASA